MNSAFLVNKVPSRDIGQKATKAAISLLACLIAVAPFSIPMPVSAEGSSDGPLLIINQDSGGPAAGQSVPQQIIVPKMGPSFGDPSSISNGAFLASASPYRWLGAYNGVPYGSVAPLFGANPYMPVATGFSAFNGGSYLPYGGLGHGFGNFGGSGGYGGYGGYGGFGNPIGFGGLGGLGLGLGMGAISALGGGYGGFGGLGGYGHMGGYGGFMPMAGMGYGGMGMTGMGMTGMGMAGMGMAGTSPEFGRLTNTRVIQTAPSKASGNYYAPATADPTASGSYYANSSGSSTSLVFPASHQTSPQSYTKPQRDYWGSGGNPFNKDLNSVPWSK